MNTSKGRRKAYRDALKARQLVRPDRFDDMMRAVIGGGSRPCDCCGLVRTLRELGETGFCSSCEGTLVKVAKNAPPPERRALRDEPWVVWVDASFRDGRAGLAVVGALGDHARTVKASTSTHAEVLALKWAMAIADGLLDLTFRTDCEKAYNALRQTPAHLRWTVEQIPRGHNHRADRLASFARLRMPVGDQRVMREAVA